MEGPNEPSIVSSAESIESLEEEYAELALKGMLLVINNDWKGADELFNVHKYVYIDYHMNGDDGICLVSLSLVDRKYSYLMLFGSSAVCFMVSQCLLDYISHLI